MPPRPPPPPPLNETLGALLQHVWCGWLPLAQPHRAGYHWPNPTELATTARQTERRHGHCDHCRRGQNPATPPPKRFGSRPQQSPLQILEESRPTRPRTHTHFRHLLNALQNPRQLERQHYHPDLQERLTSLRSATGAQSPSSTPCTRSMHLSLQGD